MASIEFQGIWFDPDSMHQRLLAEIERQKQIYAELLEQNHKVTLTCLRLQAENDALRREVEAARGRE